MTENSEILMEDAFKKVETDTFVQNLCSPEPLDRNIFQGILIKAPKEVTFQRGDRIGPFGAFAFIPVCGFYELGLESIPSSVTDICESIRVVARHHTTDAEFFGPLVQPVEGTALPVASPELDPPQKPQVPPGFTVGGYFNSNVAQYLDLPQISASYDIHTELGDRDGDPFITSNTVTVNIIELPNR